jgi:HK97 family phage major capsid protein
LKRTIARNIDKGFYQEARERGKHALTYLTEQVSPEPPEWEKIADRLKRRYRFKVDGSPLEERVNEYAYMVCGLEKLLEANGIGRSDTVEKAFFSSSNASGTQGLFPAYLASQIIAGQLAASLVPVLCMAEVRINSHVQEKVQVSDTTDTRQTKHVTEGESLPKTSIARTQGSISLQKYGRLLEASYESVRLMTLDIVSLQLQRIGRQIGIDETDDLIETSLAGDGNSGSANTPLAVTTPGTLTYPDVITLYQGFPIGYEMRHAVTNDTELKNLLSLAQFQDPMSGFDFARTGVLPGPLGATWHRWTSTGSATLGTNKIAAYDDRLAMVCYREGDLLEEADQLIDKQVHQRSMSEWVGFMVWDPAGIVAMTV